MTWKQDGNAVRGEIKQAEPFYRVQLEVETIGVNGESVVHLVDTKEAQTELNWPVSFQVRDVVVDPHYRILHWTPSIEAPK